MFEKKISPFTAMIVVCDKKGDDHIGSGVLISANHILTCSHVVDNVKVKGTIVNNKEYTIKNIYKSESKDVAIIEILDCSLNPENDVIFSDGQVLEPILTFGYPPISNIRESNHSIFRLDTHRNLTYLCAVTFKNNDYGKRKSKLSGGI